MENRIDTITKSATKLFIHKSYSKTQMKDIAKDIGLSTGMLYVYFSGKSDILFFIIKSVIYDGFSEGEFEYPIRIEHYEKVERDTINIIGDEAEHLFARIRGNENINLGELLLSLYDFISKYGTIFLLLEKNDEDLPKLFKYYNSYRNKLYNVIEDTISKQMQKGIFRELPYPKQATKLIVENISWWGMHSMHSVWDEESDSSNDQTKEACLDFILHAYLV